MAIDDYIWLCVGKGGGVWWGHGKIAGLRLVSCYMCIRGQFRIRPLCRERRQCTLLDHPPPPPPAEPPCAAAVPVAPSASVPPPLPRPPCSSCSAPTWPVVSAADRWHPRKSSGPQTPRTCTCSFPCSRTTCLHITTQHLHKLNEEASVLSALSQYNPPTPLKHLVANIFPHLIWKCMLCLFFGRPGA